MTLTSKTGRATVAAALIMSIVTHAAPRRDRAKHAVEGVCGARCGGVGGITQMPNGQVIIIYHPFYGPPKVQVALLNADRKSTTPYPNAEWQSCKNADGTWKSDFNRCVDRAGLHADANGILWLLDSAKSTDKASGSAGAGTEARRLGHQEESACADHLITGDATLTESQHNDFVVDLKHDDRRRRRGDRRELQRRRQGRARGRDLKTGTSRCLPQGHPSVMPVADLTQWDQCQATAGTFKLGALGSTASRSTPGASGCTSAR